MPEIHRRAGKQEQGGQSAPTATQEFFRFNKASTGWGPLWLLQCPPPPTACCNRPFPSWPAPPRPTHLRGSPRPRTRRDSPRPHSPPSPAARPGLRCSAPAWNLQQGQGGAGGEWQADVGCGGPNDWAAFSWQFPAWPAEGAAAQWLHPAGLQRGPPRPPPAPPPRRLPWVSRLTSITPCLTFMWRLRLPFRLNLLEQYGHLKGLLPAWRCMWPSRLYMRLKDFPQTWGGGEEEEGGGLQTRRGLCQPSSSAWDSKPGAAGRRFQGHGMGGGHTGGSCWFPHPKSSLAPRQPARAVRIPPPKPLVIAAKPPCGESYPTLHLKGLTGECTIMCVLRVCFCTKVLKQMWHW